MDDKVIFSYPSLVTNDVSKIMMSHSDTKVMVLGGTGEDFYSFMYQFAEMKCPDADIHTIIFGSENANFTQLFSNSNGRIWIIGHTVDELKTLREWEIAETENYKIGTSRIYYPHQEFHESIKLRKITPISIDTLISQFRSTLCSLQNQIHKTLQIKGSHRILILIDLSDFTYTNHLYYTGLSFRELKSSLKNIIQAAQHISLTMDDKHRISSTKQSLVTLIGVIGIDFTGDLVQDSNICDMWI